MRGCEARLFAQNFDAVLVVIVVSAGDAIFAKFHKPILKHIKLHISRHMGCCSGDSKGPGPGPGPGLVLVLVLGPALGPAWSWP